MPASHSLGKATLLRALVMHWLVMCCFQARLQGHHLRMPVLRVRKVLGMCDGVNSVETSRHGRIRS